MRWLSFHAFLLSDAERLSRFRRALEATLHDGDVVVDIGAGVGVLSFQALRQGARHVYAIESGDAIAVGHEAAERNGFSDRVTFLKERSTAVELPEPADLAVFDIFEIFGLQQGLLGVAKDAATRFLRPGGTLVPRAIELHLAPLDSAVDHERAVATWGRPHDGIDFGFVQRLSANMLHTTTVTHDAFLAEPARLARRELGVDTDVAIDGTAAFEIQRPGTLHGLVGWFAAELAEGIWVTNAPGSDSSLYARAFLPLEEPIEVDAGDRLHVQVQTHDGATWRWHGGVGAAHGRSFDHSTLFSVPDQRRFGVPSGATPP